MSMIFLSYSRKDIEAMRRVKHALTQAGHSVWTDEDLTPGTQHWARAIDENLETCDAVVVLLSPTAYQSEWVDSECSKAKVYGKGIFPLHIEGDPEDAVPLSLWSIQRIDLRKDFNGGMTELLEALRLRGYSTEVAPPQKTKPQTEEKKTQTEEESPRRKLWLLAVIIPVVLLAAWGIYKIIDGNEPSDPVVVRTTPDKTPVDIDINLTPISLVTDTPVPDEIVYVSDRDGMELVYVSEGFFTMGSNEGDSDEQPEHSVYLDSFWIDKYEVTNAQYAQCTATGRCEVPENTDYFYGSSFSDHPVVHVTWHDAEAYCNWIGRRLPTEAEWEKAARGPDGRTYPWGELEPNPALLNYDQNQSGTTSVGSFPNGASPFGALDMSGNVWEWTADWFASDYYGSSPSENPLGPDTGRTRVLRGGSWTKNLNAGIQSAYRRAYNPGISGSSLGFRCAVSVEDIE